MMIIRGSGGSAAEAPDAPTEAPNTLRSEQTARIVDAVSAGPIGGLVDGLKSVYLDNTPVQNADGTFNFEGVEYWERLGSADQAPVPGFVAAENEVSLGVEVPYGEPVTRRISNLDVDAVRVSLRWASLVSQDEDGNVNGVGMKLKIELRSADGDWYVAADDTFAGKTVTPYERMYRVELTGVGPWDTRVSKLSKDGDGSKLNNTMYWARYTELVDAKFIYPGVGYIALKVSQRQFGSDVPVRSYDVNGRPVRVPDNYDAETAEYTGLWSGEFTSQQSSNPAWVLFDILTSGNGGLDIADRHIDKWSFYDAAQWCDELVPDGRGGTRRRYTFNGPLSSQEDAYPVLQQVAASFRGILYWSSSIVTVMVDRPREASRLVTAANVVDGIFRYSSTGRTAMQSVVQVVWNDPDDDWKATVDVVEDAELISDLGLKVKRLPILGCTNRAEAVSAGLWYLEKQKSSSKSIGYVAGWDHADAMPGEVVRIIDPLSGDIRAAGRVVGCTRDYVLFDAPVTFEVAEGHKLAFSAEIARTSATDISASGVRSALISQTTDFVDAGFVAGQVVQVSGFGNPRNVGQCIIRSVEQNALIVSAPLVDEAAGATITIVARAVIERDIELVSTIEQQITIDDALVTVSGDPLLWIDQFKGKQITFIRDGVVYVGGPVVWVSGNDVPLTTRIVRFASPLEAPLPLGSMWMLTSFETTEWQIISKTEVDRNQFEIAAVSYDPTMWDRIDNGVMVDDTGPQSPYQTGSLPSPQNITVQEYLYRQGLGIVSAALLSWSAPSDTRIKYYEAQVQRPGTDGWQRVGVISGLSIDIGAVTKGSYEFRVRAIDNLGSVGPWATAQIYILGMSAPPAEPTNLRTSVSNGQVLLTWVPPTDLDLAAYELRWSNDPYTVWGSASIVTARIPGQSTSIQVPARNGAYLLKAIDFSGSYSKKAAVAVVESAPETEINFVETIEEGPAFTGQRSGLSLSYGILRLESGSKIADWKPLASAKPLSGGTRVTDGTYVFTKTINLGDVYVCRITPVIKYSLHNSKNKIISWKPLSSAKPLSGVSGNEVTITTYVMVDGKDWQQISTGDYVGQLFEFMVKIHTDRPYITPDITQISVTVDMPDRVVYGQDIDCPSDGMRVYFGSPFYTDRPSVLIDSQDMSTGDYKVVSNIGNDGFDIRFFDSGGSGVARSFDWSAHGYGSKAA